MYEVLQNSDLIEGKGTRHVVFRTTSSELASLVVTKYPDEGDISGGHSMTSLTIRTVVDSPTVIQNLITTLRDPELGINERIKSDFINCDSSDKDAYERKSRKYIDHIDTQKKQGDDLKKMLEIASDWASHA